MYMYSICICLCICVCICICILYVYVHVHLDVYVYIYVYIHVCVCVYYVLKCVDAKKAYPGSIISFLTYFVTLIHCYDIMLSISSSRHVYILTISCYKLNFEALTTLLSSQN